MAQITGSSTIDWSDVALDPIDIQQDLDEFSSRFDQVASEIDAGLFHFNSPPTSTFLSLTLNSGGILTASGSGFGANDLIINSFNFRNPSTGDVISFTGRINIDASGFIHSLKVGFPGFQGTIIGHIVIDTNGNASGSITQLQEKLGADTATFKGSLVADTNFNISGTVTEISVLSGTNVIVMSGLSLPYDALDSVATANDLFSVVGNQMLGNDTITYTNNSSAGMTFFGGAGNDTITINGPNADTLNGGDGNDTLFGGLGQDTVTGGAGDDRISMLVTGGNVDTIDAEDGNDTLVLSGIVPGDQVAVVDLSSSTDQVVSIGGVADALTQINFENLNASGIGGSVNVIGSAGDNSIIGSKGNDIIDGGAGGNDIMVGGGGDDLYMVERAGEVVTEGLNAGTDTVVATLNYTLGANLENLTLTGAASSGTGNTLNNILTGNSGNNALSGLAGNDTFTGRAGDDQLDGGLGADYMIGGLGNDTYVIDNLGDGIREQADEGTDTIQINRTVDLNVEPFTAIENVVLTGVAAINATGDAGDNLLTGNSAANILNGGGGNDTLTGNAGNDILNGGAGNDALNGGEGNDTYRLNLIFPGGGDDTITESGGTDTSVIVANGVDLRGLNFEQTGTDLVASLLGTTTTMVGQYAGPGGKVESLRIEGGASFAGYGAGTASYLLNTDPNDIGGAQQDLIAGDNTNETLNGLGGNDLLFGNGNTDTLNGGAGNDFLVGGTGHDTVDGSVGNDFIVMEGTTSDMDEAHGGTGTDTLVLSGGDFLTTGVTEVDLSVADQVVSIGGVADPLVQDGFENLDASGLIYISSVNVTGSDGANILTGSLGDDTINGGLGNDILNGGPAGSNALNGGEGDDTYRFNVFEGNDTITESGGTDTIVIVANRADLPGLNFEQSGNNLVGSGLGGSVTIVDQYTGSKVESLRFEGGASFAGYGPGTGSYLLNTDPNHTGGAQQDLIAGSSTNETLNGLGGNDLLFGNGDADTLNGGAGNDFLVGGTGEDTVDGSVGNDFVVMEVTTGDVDVAHGGVGIDTLVLSGGDPLTGVVDVDLSVADQVVFIGGTPDDTLVQDGFENFDASGLGSSVHVTGSAGANSLIGSDGGDTMNGGLGNDTLNGGTGNDVMDGGAGNDTYVVDSPGDWARETGVGAAGGKDLVQSSAANFTLEANSNIENLTLLGIANINGSGNELANILTGNSGNNQLMGLDGNDQLLGGAGDDTLDGGAGADKMAGGLGDDTYFVDVTTDVVTEALNAGTDDTVQSSVNYTLGANVEHLTLTGLENLNGTGNTLNNSITGNSGDNTLSGLAGNDILRGGLGNDTVNGGSGQDTFLFSRGDGQDVVKDSSGTADQISFDTNINPLDLVISRQANDLRIAIHGTSDQITVQNWYTGSVNRTETIQAGNGDVLLSTQVDQLIQAMAQFTINTGVSWDDASGGAGDQTQFQGILAANWQ